MPPSTIKTKFATWTIRLQKVLNTNFDRAFGLDISDKSIEIAELNKLFHFSLVNHGRGELPEGIVKDGRILDEKALAEQIKLVLQKTTPRHVSTNRVILSLPGTQVFTHHFVMNTILSGAALRLMVQKEIVKILPINPGLMYWDIKVKNLPGGGAGGNSGMSIVFMGIVKNVADSYVRVCNSIGLDVVAFGLEPFSVARLLLTSDNTVTAIIDMGTHTTNVSIMKGNDELELTVTIPLGGRNMTQAISQGLNVDEATAEAKKVAVGANTSEELFFLIEPVIKNIASEVARAISYFETTMSSKVDSLLLVGGASVMGGIKEKMVEVLGRPVNSAVHFNNFDTLESLTANKPEGAMNSMLYTSVIGLAMLGASNEFENINLLKQMPSVQINKIKRGDLFNAGYLSKTTALRALLNSRLMLAVSLLMCIGSALLFGYLWLKYTAQDRVYQAKVYKTANIRIDPLSSKDFAKILDALNGKTASSTASTTSKTSGTATSTSKTSGAATSTMKKK